jgi:thiosulfate dehydrogenase [quinone] large subunit
MFKIEKNTDAKGRLLIQDPPIAQFLFQGTIASWLWLGVRLCVGLAFLTSGLGKFTGGKWLDGTGGSILPFWQNAVKIPEAPAKPLVTFEWYRGFLQFMIDANAAPWFTYVIVFGEIAVGLGLIVGAFVGLAAMGGLLMNMAFMLAGTTSTNPVMALLAVVLILAWKNSGYIGLDYFLLPMLGTPWKQSAKASAAAPAVLTPVVAAIR